MKQESNFKWALAIVYGSAQQNEKEHFLAELVNMCSHESLPLLIGGDYNILRSPMEKNKDTFNERWPFLFNAIIDGLNLRELEIYGRKFTRTNNLQNPTYGNLDRVLMSSGWEQKFPLSMMDALPPRNF
jgi:hypothetical protein